MSFVLRYFPTRLDFVASQLEALQRTRVPLGVVGGLALIWAALGFFSAVTSAVNHAWKVEKQRGYLKQKLVAFLMLVAACGLLALTMLLFSAAQVVGAHWFFEIASRHPSLMTLRSFGVNWAATFGLIVSVGLVFYFVPNAKVRFRDVWVGRRAHRICCGAPPLPDSPGTCATCRATASMDRLALLSSS